jgi:hypothetical protein
MANAAGGTLTVIRDELIIHPSGRTEIAIEYRNAAGDPIARRILSVPADRTKPIVDNRGNQISATVPAGLANAIESFVAQVDTAIANASVSGKLDL